MAAARIDRATLQAQVNRARGEWPFIGGIESSHGLPAGLLLAVGSRETNLRNVIGDGGHGFGVWQRDNRTWDVGPSYLNDVRRQAEDAASLLATNRRSLGSWPYAVAAYNAGPSRVQQALRENRHHDYYTAGRDYSTDVMARLAIIETLGEVIVAWRVARSLLTLRDQINNRYPKRSKVSDGTIGDAAHASRDSDHNPWYGPGIVTAMDITHDPAKGVDIDRLTDELQASRDSRIKYVIANNLIMSGAGGPSPWVWRRYAGSNPHTKHFHLSVVASPACDDTRPWNLPSLTGGGGAAPGGGDDDMKADERAALFDIREQLTGSRTPGKYPGWPSKADPSKRYTATDFDRWADYHAYKAHMKTNETLALLAKQNDITAADIAAALRAGLVADVLPVLQEVVTHALGDDNAEQADAIAQSVLDKLGEKLNPEGQ